MATAPEQSSNSNGPVEGTSAGPKFIFGRLNKNYRAARQGDAEGAKETVAALTDELRKKLGRKPTPGEVQDAYRQQILARARAVMLAKMVEKNGGKLPTPDQFRDAMDRWRTANLLDEMAAVNKELGTKGSGLRGGRVASVRRRGWQQRTQNALDKAAKQPQYRAQLSRAAEALAEQAQEQRAAVAGKAGELELPLTGARAKAFRMGDRLQGRLDEFLAGQRDEIVQRLIKNEAQIRNKPGDLSVWWDEKKWKAELEKLLVPYATVLADFAADAASDRLEQPASSGKGRLEPVQPAQEQQMAEQPAAQIAVPIYLQQSPIDMTPIADALAASGAAMKAAMLEREPTVVNVPAPVINVPAPVVNVPAPVVNVEPSIVPAPVVHVAAPEKAAMDGPLDVRIVDMPDRKTTSIKEVKRDQRGLITKVVESSIDE